MQKSNTDYRLYEYFLAFIREALRDKALFHTVAEEKIRQIIRDEIILLLNEKSESSQIALSILEKKSQSRTIVTSSKFGWLKKEHMLLKLYHHLIIHGFISCDFENFKSHFFGNVKTSEPIVWHSYTKRLVYLFDQLVVYKYIPSHKNIHQLLKEHFIDMRGKGLSNGSLRSLLNDVRNNKRIQVIEAIILLLDKD